MAVQAYFPNRATGWTTGSNVHADATGYFVCDTAAELPTNVNEGDRAYAKDTDLLYVRTQAAWIEPGAASLAVHVAASDPHSVYQKESEKGAANGYAGLDGAGLVPVAQLPGLPAAWGAITGVLSAQTDLQTALDAKQPLDADLTAIAALTSAADKLPYATGAQAWALTTLSTFIRTVLDDADAPTGANAGTLIARAKREAVGTGPNVRAGSYGRLRQIS